MAQQILKFVQRESDAAKIWASLDTLPPTHNLWDDLISISVQLRLNKHWDPIISVRIIFHFVIETLVFTHFTCDLMMR